MRIKILLLINIITFLTITAHAQNVVDYLSVPGPIKINNNSYLLKWSSHPSDNYYKQEYITDRDNLEKFTSMVLLEAIVTNNTPAELVSNQIALLEKMKASNPVVNYTVMENDEEIMIDFLLSENTADGKNLKVLERNVYRYKAFTDKNGIKGIMLFAVSERRYDDDIMPFLQDLANTKNHLVNTVGTFTIPQIIISRN